MTAPGPLAALKARHPGAECFTFGDRRAPSDELLARVGSGRRTATCGALRDFTEGGEALPLASRRDIAPGWDGTPALVSETTRVTLRRFGDVGADFAPAEGEDETLAGWQAGHSCFERNGGRAPGLRLVCERFRLIEDLAT